MDRHCFNQPHFQLRAKSVHVDMAIVIQLRSKFRGQDTVYIRREIAQGIGDGELATNA